MPPTKTKHLRSKKSLRTSMKWALIAYTSGKAKEPMWQHFRLSSTSSPWSCETNDSGPCSYSHIPTRSTQRKKKDHNIGTMYQSCNQGEILHRITKKRNERPRGKGVIRQDIQRLERDVIEENLLIQDLQYKEDGHWNLLQFRSPAYRNLETKQRSTP